MVRINVYDHTDSLAGWFEASQADAYNEGQRTDNQYNDISLATGNEFEHQQLYRTAGGRWVLASWSRRGESGRRHHFITAQEAQAWLVRCEYSNTEIEKATGLDLAPERGPGKPAIGTQIKATITDDDLAAVDELVAAGVAKSRSEAVRQLVAEALTARAVR